MSLLDRGSELVTVYPEVTETDPDGNVRTRPSSIGTVVKAVVQPASSSKDDTSDQGFISDGATYRLRLARGAPVLGAQAAVEWRGVRWAVLGEPVVYNGSRRTAHTDYTIGRQA